jgi:hypothetical protein
VLLVSFEDTAAEILRPRVEAAGGDLSRVHEVVVDRLDIDPVCLPRDVDDLVTLATGVGARLVVFDPIVAALETSLDAHKDQHVRVVLAQLAAFAEEAGCAISMVGHLNKAPSREAYLRIGGSVAFYNAARSVVLVTEDKGDPEMRLVSQAKANYSRTRPVERHRIEEIILPGTLDPETGEPVTTSRMVFVEFAEDVDEADLLAPRESAAPTREAEATRFLVRELACGAWCESAPIKGQAEAQGIAERTLQRAVKDLGVEVDRRGFPSITYWRLSGATADRGDSRATPVPTDLARLGEPLNHAENGASRSAVAPVAPVAPLAAVENGSETDWAPKLDGFADVDEAFEHYQSKAQEPWMGTSS